MTVKMKANQRKQATFIPRNAVWGPVSWVTVSSAMTMMMVRRVTKPLKAVTETLTVLAEGTEDVEIHYSAELSPLVAVEFLLHDFSRDPVAPASNPATAPANPGGFR